MPKKIYIENIPVGEDSPCFVIAEIGSNHNGNYDQAVRLIDSAADAGVNAVKFQTFKASSHYSKYAPGFGYLNNISTYELINSLEINREWHKPLKEYAESIGLVFMSSPCDIEAVEELNQIGMAAFKLASFDLPDLSLIKVMAKTGKPLILSTGMANWMEIQNAIKVANSVGNHQISLLQCTSLYPAPIKLSNISAMKTMKDAFDVVVGYSDHTMGEHICLAAVAQGASIIEKHFTLDRGLQGPDHQFAIEPKELKLMMQHLREVESAVGDGVKLGPHDEEQEMYEKGRRSLHATQNICAGEVISEDMLTIKRPGLGIEPFLKQNVVGRVVQQDIKQDEWITWEKI